MDALEALPAPTGPAPIGRLHLVGEHPNGIEVMLREALGPSIGEAIRYPGAPGSLWEAIAAAQSSPESAPGEVVLVLDLAGPIREGSAPRRGTGAGALRIANGAGCVLISDGPSSPDARETPSARATTPIGQAADPVAPAAAYLPLLRGLREATAARALGTIAPARDAAVGGPIGLPLRRDAPIPWIERGPATPLPRTADETRRRLDPAPASVSEGAYVPRTTYLESRPSRWRFVAEACSACGVVSFPARGRCRACGRSDTLQPLELPRSGLPVEATTVVHPGAQPTEFDLAVRELGPYEVVIARAAPTVRVTLQLADGAAGTVRIGDRVDTRLRRLFPMEGEWRYGRKAVVSAAGSPRPTSTLPA